MEAASILMMDALISMHMELRRSYGPEESDATNLIRLPFASTRKAVLEKIVPTSDNKNKYYTKAQKFTALFELLESLLTTKSPEGLRASQRVCMVTIIPNFYVHFPHWWLLRNATFASTELEALGYSLDESILQKFWKICELQLNIP
ncbi:hypothetical protein H5410_027599, partial [Solanum commersonii]